MSLVTLSEFKAHSRVDTSDEDTIMQVYLDAAEAAVASYTGLVIEQESLTSLFDKFSEGMQLRGPNVSAITISYQDEDNATQTLASSVYLAQEKAYFCGIYLKNQQSFPATLVQKDVVSIAYTAGYTTSTLPKDLKSAILLIAGHLFDHREDVVIGASAIQLPMGSERLMRLHRSPVI